MRQVQNPPNPYLKFSAEFVGEEPPPSVRLEVFEETATRRIITENNSPDVGFKYSVNCYRGCIHGCTYCFARPYHEFLGYGAGTDFETKIVVKINAAELLRNELRRARRKIDNLNFSFTTDPYLPLEANYELTRNCLKVCRDFRVPVGIVTKSPLVARDTDVLSSMNAAVYFSIPFPTTEKSKPFEPYAPVPEARFRAMRTLADSGVRVGLALAPVIPSYNDADIPALLEKARDHGATEAFMTLLRLPTESLREYFIARLNEKIPTKAARILNQIRRERGGKLNSSAFGERMAGKTENWQIAVKLFELHFKRLGYRTFEESCRRVQETAAVVGEPIQQRLFE